MRKKRKRNVERDQLAEKNQFLDRTKVPSFRVDWLSSVFSEGSGATERISTMEDWRIWNSMSLINVHLRTSSSRFSFIEYSHLSREMRRFCSPTLRQSRKQTCIREKNRFFRRSSQDKDIEKWNFYDVQIEYLAIFVILWRIHTGCISGHVRYSTEKSMTNLLFRACAYAFLYIFLSSSGSFEKNN